MCIVRAHNRLVHFRATTMAAPIEENVYNALRGHLSQNTKLPAPLIIKIYVASTKNGNRASVFFHSSLNSLTICFIGFICCWMFCHVLVGVAVGTVMMTFNLNNLPCILQCFCTAIALTTDDFIKSIIFVRNSVRCCYHRAASGCKIAETAIKSIWKPLCMAS